MRFTSPFALLLVLAAGCTAPGGPATYDSPVGAYEGSGKFDGGVGKMEVSGKLTLSADGRYALAIKPMGSLGSETGSYLIEGETLRLTPDRADPNAQPSLANALSRSRTDKTMKVAAGFTSISWADGPMQIEMKRIAP